MERGQVKGVVLQDAAGEWGSWRDSTILPLQLFKGRRTATGPGTSQGAPNRKEQHTGQEDFDLPFSSKRTCGIPSPRGSCWVARASAPRLAKGLFKPGAPLNLTWHSALVAQPRPGQHCPYLGHLRDWQGSPCYQLPSARAAPTPTECD